MDKYMELQKEIEKLPTHWQVFAHSKLALDLGDKSKWGSLQACLTDNFKAEVWIYREFAIVRDLVSAGFGPEVGTHMEKNLKAYNKMLLNGVVKYGGCMLTGVDMIYYDLVNEAIYKVNGQDNGNAN